MKNITEAENATHLHFGNKAILLNLEIRLPPLAHHHGIFSEITPLKKPSNFEKLTILKALVLQLCYIEENP
ncbi:MAG: hypothetical protein ACKPB3_10025 [Bacteroidota bacterium]